MHVTCSNTDRLHPLQQVQVPGTFAFLPQLSPFPHPRYLHRLLNLFTTTPQSRNRVQFPTNIRRSRGKTFRVARASPASQAFPRSTPCAVAQTVVTDLSQSAPDQSPTSISTSIRPHNILRLDLQKKQDVSVSVGVVCMVRSVHSGMHTRQIIPTNPTFQLLRDHQLLSPPQYPARSSVSLPILLSSTVTTWTSVTSTTTVGTHVLPACPVYPTCPAYPSHPSRPPFPTTVSFMPPLSHPRYPALLPP